MSLTQTFIGTLTVVTCDCGVTYGLDSSFIANRRQDHKIFFCPNGCRRHYPEKNEAERLKEQLLAKENTIAWMNRRNDSLHTQLTGEKNRSRSLKAAKTRLKNRVANGVCPCCNRTFVNLLNHMKNQHPEFRS